MFFFGVAYGKKSLEEIFNEIWPMARNQSSSEFKRMLDGCFFWGLPTARNLWRKSLMKYGLWPEIIIFKKISTENALEFLAFGKGFILDRLRLDI